jgi:ankyrin repeat protein
LNTRNYAGATAVLAAAAGGHTAVIRLLYKLGANMKPDAPWTVSGLAQETESSDVVEYIDKILSKMTNECENCGSSSKRLKLCSKCEKVRYCSRDCQVKDYKEHKKECGKRRVESR